MITAYFLTSEVPHGRLCPPRVKRAGNHSFGSLSGSITAYYEKQSPSRLQELSHWGPITVLIILRINRRRTSADNLKITVLHLKAFYSFTSFLKSNDFFLASSAMIRQASRCLFRPPLDPVRSSLTRRFLSTTPPARKSRSWKSSAARWGLAVGAVYYYNTSTLFAEEPPCPPSLT